MAASQPAGLDLPCRPTPALRASPKLSDGQAPAFRVSHPGGSRPGAHRRRLVAAL